MFSYQVEASAGDAGYKKVSEVAVRGLCSKPDAEDHAGDGDRNAERNPKAWGYAESFAQDRNSEARRNVVRQATKDAYRNQPDEGPGNRQRHGNDSEKHNGKSRRSITRMDLHEQHRQVSAFRLGVSDPRRKQSNRTEISSDRQTYEERYESG